MEKTQHSCPDIYSMKQRIKYVIYRFNSLKSNFERFERCNSVKGTTDLVYAVGSLAKSRDFVLRAHNGRTTIFNLDVPY